MTTTILAQKYYSATQAHINKLYAGCHAEGLIAPGYFWLTAKQYGQAVYNGIGPDAWSPKLRKFITWILNFFEEDAFIHDMMFQFAPRTRWAFLLANIMFAINACILAVRRRQWRKIPLGLLLAILCQLGGWQGFKSVNNNKESDKQNAKIIHYRYGYRGNFRRGL